MTTNTAHYFAHLLRHRQASTLNDLSSIIHHPRSLARPSASWRPPLKRLPAPPEGEALNVTITRHRVGPQAKARVFGFGEDRVPAYLLTLRFTDPRGGSVDVALAEGWVRALIHDAAADAVHEVTVTDHAPTFVWLADSDYLPVRSPASLFGGFEQAA